MNPFFTPGGQTIGALASTSVLPMNIQDWFPLGLTGLISLQSKGLSRIFSKATIQNHQFFGDQFSHPYMTTGKAYLWLDGPFSASLLFNMLSRPPRTNTKKRCSIYHRGMECKSRKSRDTWSNRQVWPWSTKWSRVKANRILPREYTGHSKHPFPTTQETTLYMNIIKQSIPKVDWLYSL